jgi:phage gp36-like protein
VAYITNSDIEKRLGHAAYVQFTDDFGSGSADDAVVDEARAGAEGEVDSYLARRYAVPIDLATNPELGPLLVSTTLDLAEYRLRLRRPPVAAESRAAHDAAVAWLQMVARGEIDLPVRAALPASPSQEYLGRSCGSNRILTDEELSQM